jgi:hypothetical protein
MRKYLSLITEHDDEDLVGKVKATDRPLASVEKNVESPIQRFDEQRQEFETVGRQVGLGYHDFEDEADYEDRFAEVVKQKLAEIDAEHLEKTGIDSAEVGR